MRILTRAFEILWSMSFGIGPSTQPNEFKHVESCNLALTVHHDPIDYWHKCARTPTYNYIYQISLLNSEVKLKSETNLQNQL